MIDLVRHAQVQLGLALVALLLCIGALAWRNVFGRPRAPDLVVPAALERLKLSQLWRGRAARGLELGFALIALVLAGMFTTMTGAHGQGLDHPRVLHEVVQAKYQAELGWDRLYACAWAADRDHEGHIAGVERIRVVELDAPPELVPTPEPVYEIRRVDDKLRKVVVDKPKLDPRQRPRAEVGGKLRPASAVARELGCRERFDDARWDALAADVGLLAQTAPPKTLQRVFEGFGSTASPARLARQRLLFSVVPVSVASLYGLMVLGGLALLAALFAVERAFGLSAAALVGVVALSEFAASPLVSGASTANALVVAALIAALALVALERWAAAGALLAFAALDSGWPALVLLALVAKLGVDLAAGEDRKAALTRALVGAGGCAALLFLVSLTLPGGAANWSIWLDRLALVRYADGTHEVGLRWMFTPDGGWLGGPKEQSYPERAQNMVDRRGWTMICAALLMAPALLSVRRLATPAFAALAGVSATFALLSTHATAWTAGLALLALAAAAVGAEHKDSRLLVGRPTTVLVAGCLAVSVGMHGMGRVQPYAPWLFNMIYSHLLATLMLGLGAALLLVPGLREPGDPPGRGPIPVGNPPPPKAEPEDKPAPEPEDEVKS